LIGASGMLGQDILEGWNSDEVIPAFSRDADIRDLQQVQGLVTRTKLDWIVLTAAYTDVDGSEKNQQLQYKRSTREKFVFLLGDKFFPYWYL
jgi:dTDP-4-dehydrorhamnose reductase